MMAELAGALPLLPIVLICAFLGPALIASVAYDELVPLPGDGRDEYVPITLVSYGVGLTALFIAAWVLLT